MQKTSSVYISLTDKAIITNKPMGMCDENGCNTLGNLEVFITKGKDFYYASSYCQKCSVCILCDAPADKKIVYNFVNFKEEFTESICTRCFRELSEEPKHYDTFLKGAYGRRGKLKKILKLKKEDISKISKWDEKGMERLLRDLEKEEPKDDTTDEEEKDNKAPKKR